MRDFVVSAVVCTAYTPLACRVLAPVSSPVYNGGRHRRRRRDLTPYLCSSRSFLVPLPPSPSLKPSLTSSLLLLTPPPKPRPSPLATTSPTSPWPPKCSRRTSLKTAISPLPRSPRKWRSTRKCTASTTAVSPGTRTTLASSALTLSLMSLRCRPLLPRLPRRLRPLLRLTLCRKLCRKLR